MMSRSKYYSGAIAVLIIGLIITIGLFLKLKWNKNNISETVSDTTGNSSVSIETTERNEGFSSADEPTAASNEETSVTEETATTADKALKEKTINRIDKLCVDNGYDETVKTRLKQMFEIIEKNYDDFREANILLELPDCESYINYLINHIDEHNTKIVIFKEDEKYDKILNDAGAIGLYDPVTKEAIVKDYEDTVIETLFEELLHSTQDNLFVTHISDLKKNYKNMRTCLTEGEPGFFRSIFKGGIYYDCGAGKTEGNVHWVTNSLKMDNNGIQGKNYYILNYLAKHEAMLKYKETDEVSTLKSAIESHYDIDVKKLFRYLDISYDDIAAGDGITIDNMFCDCIIQDIEKIDSKETAINLLNSYRYYKLQFGSDCYILNGSEITEKITDSKIKYNEVESLLKEKIIKYDCFKINNVSAFLNALLTRDTYSDADIKYCMNIKNISYCEEKDKIFFKKNRNNEVTVYDINAGDFEAVSDTEKNFIRIN